MLQSSRNRELRYMKHITFMVIVLLLTIQSVYADGNPAEETDHWEKVRQMDQLAERFKAETGFTGNVNYNIDRMKLRAYEGKFTDIPFSADADTTAFRQACDRILDKILPYSYAKIGQLSMSRISRRTGYISTDYYQIVNGYCVEGSGFIVITYDVGRYRFDIGDNTVELSEERRVNISLTQAIEIAKEVYNPNYKLDKSIEFSDPKTELLYTKDPQNITDNSYRLNYKISFWGLAIYIDPYSGKLAYTRSFIIKD